MAEDVSVAITCRAAIPEIDPEKASTDIYIVDLATGARSRVTSDPGWEQFPVWSPAGDRVAYRLGPTVYVQQVSGGKPARVGEFGGGAVGLRSRLVARTASTCSSRARRSPAASLSGFRSRMAGSNRLRRAPPLHPAMRGSPPMADGSRTFRRETGSTEVHVRSFPDGRVTQRITTTGGDAPLWNHDGTELFYRDGEGWVTACRVRTTGSDRRNRSPRAPVQAKPRQFMGRGVSARYRREAADSSSFRVGDDAGSFANSLTVMQNWTKAIAR